MQQSNNSVVCDCHEDQIRCGIEKGTQCGDIAIWVEGGGSLPNNLTVALTNFHIIHASIVIRI